MPRGAAAPAARRKMERAAARCGAGWEPKEGGCGEATTPQFALKPVCTRWSDSHQSCNYAAAAARRHPRPAYRAADNPRLPHAGGGRAFSVPRRSSSSTSRSCCQWRNVKATRRLCGRANHITSECHGPATRTDASMAPAPASAARGPARQLFAIASLPDFSFPRSFKLRLDLDCAALPPLRARSQAGKQDRWA
jgi:hypothetical protein